MGFRGFQRDRVTDLAAAMARAAEDAPALHRRVGAILAQAQEALDSGQKATHSHALQNVLETSAGTGILLPTAGVRSGAGMPGSLSGELDAMAADIRRRLALFDEATGPDARKKGLSPVDAFNEAAARPAPEPRKRPWWKKWVLDPIEGAATDVAEVMQVVFSPDALTGIFETALGAGLMTLGAAGEFGGAALDITGVGAAAGVPLNIASAAAIAGGGALAYKGLGDFMAAMSQGDYNAWGRPSRKGPKSPQPREADPLGDEQYGGHGVERHVGRSDKQLAERLSADKKIRSASTYRTVGDAEKFSQEVIDARKQRISNWLKEVKQNNSNSRVRTRVFELKDTGNVTGRNLLRSAWHNGQGARDVSGARVVLRADPNAPGGYFILTTFPF